ncbi:hypothetical protein QYM36_009425, partial [Artemia franciscana]
AWVHKYNLNGCSLTTASCNVGIPVIYSFSSEILKKRDFAAYIASNTNYPLIQVCTAMDMIVVPPLYKDHAIKKVESDLEVTRDRVEDLEDLDLEFMLTEKCKLVEELPEKIHKKEKGVQTMKKEKHLMEQIHKDSEAQIMERFGWA